LGKHGKNIHVAPHFPKKHHLGPQNGSESFKTQKIAKNSKLPKLSENYFEPVGKGGWQPISTWIIIFMGIACLCCMCMFTVISV
jgi:hypothetical protein